MTDFISQLPARVLGNDPDGGVSNDTRAEWAEASLDAMAHTMGEDMFEDLCPEDGQDLIGDLIGNLLHVCDRYGFDAEKLWQRGREHWQTERTVS